MHAKRWPLIRHVRWAWLNYRLQMWCQAWGRFPSPRDVRYLQDVWEGKA